MSPYKYIVGFLSILLSLCVKAQVIDTVCPGEKNIRYYVFQNPGATYLWEVEGGILVSGNGTNEVLVNWGLASGLFTITVKAKNELGCEGDVQTKQIWVKGNQPQVIYPPKICKNDSIELKVKGASNILWDNLDTAKTRKMRIVSDTSGYVIATDSNCSSYIDTLHYQVKLGQMPLAMFSPDTGIFHKNESVLIKYQGNTTDQLNWQIKKLNIFDKSDHSFLIFLQDTGTTEIKLLAISKDGCIDSSYRWVFVEDEYLQAPNAFSPNGDGINDTYHPVTSGLRSYQLLILNRWGETMFETNNPDVGWDGNYKGSPAQPDVYLYFIEARGNSRKEYYQKGNVTLIR